MKIQITILIAILLAPLNYAMGEEPPGCKSFVPALCNGIISYDIFSGRLMVIKPNYSTITITNNEVCMENMSLDIFNSESGEFIIQGDKVVLTLYNAFSTRFYAIHTEQWPSARFSTYSMDFFPENIFSFNGELKTARELAALGKLCAGNNNKSLQQSVPGYPPQGVGSPEP